MNNLGFCPHCVRQFGWPFEATNEQKRMLRELNKTHKLEAEVINIKSNKQQKKSIKGGSKNV